MKKKKLFIKKMVLELVEEKFLLIKKKFQILQDQKINQKNKKIFIFIINKFSIKKIILQK